MEEVKNIRKFVSDLTHSPFERREPYTSYSVGRSKWYIGCLDAHYAGQAPYLTDVWADKEDNIWLETALLGTTIEWAEQTHNERARAKLRKLKLTDFAKPEVRSEFGRIVPRVLKRLEVYERLIAEVSSETGIPLEMKYDAQEHIVAFQIGTKIEAKSLSLETKLAKIKIAVDALRIAYDRIDKCNQAVFGGKIRAW